MDRRSWLWRRKSSEKSPGETESSGSLSSHSERFSDEQACANSQTQSPEVTSKTTPSDEELNDTVKTLKEKLSAALENIRAKDELVKQHAKVAEEAVSGWEKAEQDVLALKQKLESATHKASSLEDRVGHLDGALKECLRQLRQAKEEQEQRIHEALTRKVCEWEFTRSELESQLVELQTQLQATQEEVITFSRSDLRPKLDAAEQEILVLKLELQTRYEELELRTIERDLSTHAAETASKQHLESIKRVAKLEAECRRLKAIVRRASLGNDQRSATASSLYVESFMDSQSDSGERLLSLENETRKISTLEPDDYEPNHPDSWASALIQELDQFKNEKALGRNLMVPSVEINLMDDFLEMERLAALPETDTGSCCPESSVSLDQHHDKESTSKAELEAMINQNTELTGKLEKMVMEKTELETAFAECCDQLKISQNKLMEAEMRLRELQAQLSIAIEAKLIAEGELEATNTMRDLAETKLTAAESGFKDLLSKVCVLEEELRKERAMLAATETNCRKLEADLSRMTHEIELRNAAKLNGELKMKQDKELAVAASKLANCQKTIASLGRQLKSLATLEDFLVDSDKPAEFPKERSHFPERRSTSTEIAL